MRRSCCHWAWGELGLACHARASVHPVTRWQPGAQDGSAFDLPIAVGILATEADLGRAMATALTSHSGPRHCVRRLQNGCRDFKRTTLLTTVQESPTRTLYKHFTSVSPDLSGHGCQTDRAPMLVGTPLADKVSAKAALGPALWIRRVLVRAQEGQLQWPHGLRRRPLSFPAGGQPERTLSVRPGSSS